MKKVLTLFACCILFACKKSTVPAHNIIITASGNVPYQIEIDTTHVINPPVHFVAIAKQSNLSTDFTYSFSAAQYNSFNVTIDKTTLDTTGTLKVKITYDGNVIFAPAENKHVYTIYAAYRIGDDNMTTLLDQFALYY